MRKISFVTVVFGLLLAVMTVSAQKRTTDFTAGWELDVAKSKLSDAAKVESMTLKVLQTAKELTIETTVKRSADAGRGGIGGGMRRGGGSDGGAQTVIFSLDGKESVTDIGSGIMAGSEARTAKVTADGKLSLTTTRKFTSEMGGSATKSNETWELLDGGKTLKIIRYIETPRGGVNSELYFTKKSADENLKNVDIVKVAVTINEKGNVVSAKAASGTSQHRKAAEQAAMKAKFEPTILNGDAVQVSGSIIYKFVPDKLVPDRVTP